MESCDVIAFQSALIRTSLIADADVRVTKAPFDDVDRHFFLSSGDLSADENLRYVEAVPIAASELKTEDTYIVEIRPRPDEDITRSGSGIRHKDGDPDKSGEGKEPDAGEQSSVFGRVRLDSYGETKKAGPQEEEAKDPQMSLIEGIQRLALQPNEDRPSSRSSDSKESSDQKADQRLVNLPTDEDRLARGPIGGTAVAYPPRPPPNWTGQTMCPGVKRTQFVGTEFAHFGNDIFIDSTLVGSFSAGDEGCLFQPSKYKKGPQPVESDDPSLPDEASLPFTWLSSKEVAEVLGNPDIDDFFLTDFNDIPEPSQKIKCEPAPYSPDHQFQNGPIVGELVPTAIPTSSSFSFLNQYQHHQQPSISGIPILRTHDPINALSHGPILPAINGPSRFFQPGRTVEPNKFCDEALNLGSCTGFQVGESSPPESGFGGSDCSQSPHPSAKGSPGRDDDFSLESQENLAEIVAFLNFIENEGQTPNGNHPAITPSTKYIIPPDHPPHGRQSPSGKHSQNPAPSYYQTPLVNHQPKPTNPPSASYQFPLESHPVPQSQFHHPPYSTVASFQSSPIQRTSISSSVGSTSPAVPPGPSIRFENRTTRVESSAESTMRRPNGSNSTAPETQLKDQSLMERKQLAKASSVIARLTRDQLVTPDADQDTLLHLAIAKNERYLTEALICRLDRDQLTNSMINLKNKQGQTPLCLATVTNQWALVRLLVDRGADVNVPIPLGAKHAKSFCSPLHFAAGNGREWVRTLEEILRAKNIDLKALDSEGCSALHKAVLANGMGLFYGRSCEMIDSRESVRQLVIHGVDISQQDGVHSKTALTYALERGDFDLFYYILDLVHNPRASLPPLLNARTGRRGDTLLHVAATLQTDLSIQMTLVRHLVSRGANPQMRNWDNRLPWELATHSQIAEALRVPACVGLQQEMCKVSSR